MSTLPQPVIEALSKGNLMEALKLLRSSGMGLKQAKDALEAHARGKAAPEAPTFSAGFGGTLPPDVLEALEMGRKIEAVRLMREQTGLGLKESKEAVDAYQQLHLPAAGGLSPGQVGDTGSGIWWVVALALVCLAIYFVLRRL